MSAGKAPITPAARISCAARLNAATKAGDLSGAYRVLQEVRAMSKEAGEAVMLEAGYSVTHTRSARDFWTVVQGDVARAARGKVDGWGLRNLEVAP